MIKIVYGAKGTGKTKIMIDLANDCIAKVNGDVIFLAETNRYMHEIKYQIRFTNVNEHNIVSEDGLIGFIKGMIAGNYDIKTIFIDKAHKMMSLDVEALESFIENLAAIAKDSNVDFVLSISRDLEEMPNFIKKYV